MALAAAKVAFFSLGLNYGVHYTSARLYDWVCVPHSLSELVTSLATTASPVCSFLLHTMTATQNNYAVVMTSTVTALLAKQLTPT